MVGNCEGDVLGPSDGGLVGRSLKACRLVHQMGPGWVRGESWVCAGAMAMHLAEVPDQTLMAIGRWRSLGFMVYIQQQISSFSTGVSVKMSQQPWFRHL